MSKNKTGRYFKYAIGEIALVVVGILIALSVNNQNELRKANNEEQKNLLGLENDFTETRKRLIRTIHKQERVVDYSQRLINIIENDEAIYNSDSISSYLTFGATSYWRAEPVIGTYDALIGSGKISIIKNQELLTSLAKFSAVSKLPFEDEANSMNLLNLIAESISDIDYILTAEGNRRHIRATHRYSEQEKQLAIKKLIANKPFLSYLISRTSTEKNRRNRQESLLGFAQDILSTMGIQDILLSEEELQKYVGIYELDENREDKEMFKTIILTKEDQLYARTFGLELELLPDDQDSYYVPRADAVIKFKLEDNKAIRFTYTNENDSLGFKKISTK